MKQANAAGGRAGFLRVLQEHMHRLADASSAKSPLLSLHPSHETSRLPVWMRFFASERVLRRLIPLLIGGLLLLVAAVRTQTLMIELSNIEIQARSEIALTTQLAQSRLSANSELSTTLQDSDAALAVLRDALPARSALPDISIYLADSTGKIVAQRGGGSVVEGVLLGRLIGRDFVESAGTELEEDVRSILFDGTESALASSVPLELADKTIAGYVALVHPSASLFESWRTAVKVNVTLFLAIGSVLLIIVYAYFVQGARTRETESLYFETNARFDTALARGRCGLWDWDLSRGSIVWSPSMHQMLGRAGRSRAMGYGELAELLHPDDRNLLQIANETFQESSRQIDHRFRILHASGGWVSMRLRAELVHYRGAVPHLIGIAVDVSEQEALKRQSRDADIRLREAIDNISEAFVLWDAKERMVLCNGKYQQLFNLPSSAIRHGVTKQDVAAIRKAPVMRSQVNTDRNQKHHSNTFEAQLDDGRWFQISERPTLDGGAVSVGTDITQIKRNQSKLEDSEREHLATIVELRKMQQNLVAFANEADDQRLLADEQRKQADEANKSKSQFLANMSHELRTPLNAIIGFSDIMREGMFGPLGNEKYTEYANDIRSSGGFLLGVINDVLDMSKIEAGRMQIYPEELAVSDLLQETLRIIAAQADDGELQVTTEIETGLDIIADRRAVKQVLINLLSNAVKFTPKGGSIQVSARRLDDNVEMEILDSGIGISQDALERIGLPFEQAASELTRDHVGSGLGLAIAKSLAELHGGSVDISSIEGIGTTVLVRLPLDCTSHLDAEKASDEDEILSEEKPELELV
ncbi:PAS domain-containing sensor histidine kinase [Ahrensia sp. R2A130]|uniref:sensor histidine kinase n=1 Tax=Ahrensia sp. R2A130 TaxID=744979 RepID=UPI0001E0E8D8|nr:PAS domain-containing sensor histidine kinase [Ahrensia sp. R2A130]EFL88982.1 PAS/PAC sensor signal transduction histidine kinase [Ahrensia sp. R2A130]